LYSYLLAKQTKGEFLLRIEDTDQARSVPGAVENILESLEWAHIPPDEGVMLEKGVIVQKGTHGPYFQSERLEIYKKYADELITNGHAYHCFCTSQRLEEMRKGQEARKQAPMYDRTCAKLSPDDIAQKLKEGIPHVIRMKIPHEKTITFHDDIRGLMSFQGHTVLDETALKIIDTALRTGAVVHGPIPLPTKIKRFTVNRSTFVHKDARDQFEMRIHRRLIDLSETTFKTVDGLQNLSLPSGVDIEIRMG
jgi:ribosomal protein S10